MTLKCPYYMCRTAGKSRDASSMIQGVSELLLGYQLGTQIWVVLPSPVDAVGLSPSCDHASSHTINTQRPLGSIWHLGITHSQHQLTKPFCWRLELTSSHWSSQMQAGGCQHLALLAPGCYSGVELG